MHPKPYPNNEPNVTAILFAPTMTPDSYIGANYFTVNGAKQVKKPTQDPWRSLPMKRVNIFGNNINMPANNAVKLQIIKFLLN